MDETLGESTPTVIEHPSVKQFDYSSMNFTRGSDSAIRGGQLIFDTTGDPAHLNPLTSKDSYEGDINQFIIDTMVTWDLDTDEALPYLADGWLVENLPAGGQAFTFHLNPNACFSDRIPVTADDVLFSFNVFFDDDYPTSHQRPYYASIASVTKIDQQTVRFETVDNYYLNFTMLGTLQILPRHLYEPYMVAKYKEKQENPEPNMSLHPVGSGPYIFQEWIRGKQIILKRDPNWWGDALPHFKNCYNFDKLRIKIIKDSKISFEHFKRGDIDYYTFESRQWVKETQSRQFIDGTLKKLEVFNKIPRGYTFIGWNLIDPEKSDLEKQIWVPHPLFGNTDVRLAMTHLIDRRLYVQKYLYGYSMLCTSPFGNRSDYSDPNIKPWEYDPDEALKLLRKAGWDDHDRDTILDKTIDGRKIDFIFTLLLPADSPAMEAMASIIKEDMRQVGVIMEIKTVEWNSFQKLTDDKAFDAFSMGWTGSIHPDPRGLWHSSSVALGGNNLCTYINPELDKLSDKGVTTMDKSIRIKCFQRIHQILHEDQPYTFLTEPLCDLLGVNSRIQMMNSTITGQPYFQYGIGAVKYWWIKNPSGGSPKAGS